MRVGSPVYPIRPAATRALCHTLSVVPRHKVRENARIDQSYRLCTVECRSAVVLPDRGLYYLNMELLQACIVAPWQYQEIELSL